MKFFVAAAIAVLSCSVVASSAEACEGLLALRGKDIVLRPGETQVFTYDFRECTAKIGGLWAYVADALTPSTEGCATRVSKGTRLDMQLEDLLTGLQGTKVSGTSTILNAPADENGVLKWGTYVVTGTVVELRITLDPGAKRCLQGNLRWAYFVGGS